MAKFKYAGPASVFSHGGKDYKQGEDVDIDDATLALMSRHGHIFEGYVKEGTPLLGYDISPRVPSPTLPTMGNAVGAGSNLNIEDAPPARLDQERGEQIQKEHEQAEKAERRQ